MGQEQGVSLPIGQCPHLPSSFSQHWEKEEGVVIPSKLIDGAADQSRITGAMRSHEDSTRRRLHAHETILFE
jgi:hypothetical protein